MLKPRVLTGSLLEDEAPPRPLPRPPRPLPLPPRPPREGLVPLPAVPRLGLMSGFTSAGALRLLPLLFLLRLVALLRLPERREGESSSSSSVPSASASPLSACRAA